MAHAAANGTGSGPELELIGYWRSSAAYRVRIALNLKGLDPRMRAVNLQAGDQSGEAYRRLNPQSLVPTLLLGDGPPLTQSLAIIEWLEDIYPDPQLLPADPAERALARAAALDIACDIHPLNNLRVLKYLRGPLGQPEDRVQAWIARWIAQGLEGLETRLSGRPGDFVFGTRPGLFEACLIPQLYSARRFGVDLAPYARLRRAEAAANALPAFQRAAPEQQNDAPRAETD